jgi:MFS family permease
MWGRPPLRLRSELALSLPKGDSDAKLFACYSYGEEQRMFKRILLAGWLLLLLDGFLVVMFPNTPWNRAASWVLWVLSIALFFSTVAFCVVVAARLASRIGKRITQSPLGDVQQSTACSEKRKNRLVLGLLAVLGIGVFVVVLLAFIEHQIRTSPVYQASVAKARTSSQVVKVLGEPIKEGWFSSGELTQSTDGSGSATLMIPLSGPKGKGVLKVEAARLAGSWRFSTLQFSAAQQALTVDLRGDDQRN